MARAFHLSQENDFHKDSTFRTTAGLIAFDNLLAFSEDSLGRK